MRLAQSHADTSTGRKRRHNEDSFVCQPPLFAVADGMGGAQAGEVASALAAETLSAGTFDATSDGPARLVELIKAANRRVYERAHDDVNASGMGTTTTAALYQDGGTIVIGHVGDSRAYVLRDGALKQLTEDHSLVAELVRRGELAPHEAESHPQRSVITRALGTDPDVDVDSFSFQAQPGDLFLICSDGLTSMVDVNTVMQILQTNRLDLGAASRALLKTANDRGGEDNITTVLFTVGADDEELTVAASTVPPASSAPADEDTLHPEDGVQAPSEPAPRQRTMVMSPEAVRAALRGDAGEPADDATVAYPPGHDPAEAATTLAPAVPPPPDPADAETTLSPGVPASPPPDPADAETTLSPAVPAAAPPDPSEAATTHLPAAAPPPRPDPSEAATTHLPATSADEAPSEAHDHHTVPEPTASAGKHVLAVIVVIVLIVVIVVLLVKGLTR